MPGRRNPPPTDDRRQAIVWDRVERLAFRPDNNERAWLGVYAKTLHKLWQFEIKPDWERHAAGQLLVPFLNLTCQYALETVDKYVATISAGDRPVLALHVDPEYRSKAGLHSAPERYPHQQRRDVLRGDVEAVLDGMIFHTRTHSHLRDIGLTWPNGNGGSQPELLDLHEIRIGTGIENSYVFLFHLRYQFCLVSDTVRLNERGRLVTLFHDAIADGERSISPRDLFDWGK